MKRRDFMAGVAAVVFMAWPGVGRAQQSFPDGAAPVHKNPLDAKDKEKMNQNLTREQCHVLDEQGTERPFTSPHLGEKRTGVFVCARCKTPLFRSSTKFDSGTGWPSFDEAIPGALGTSEDNKLGYTRIEYHCKKCGGHQGHVFKDGPTPTGLRYCNNGITLEFVPDPGQ
ncbi:MAG TPA: peptide-methionine (R)-S-oxide reductase MsrB [Alphaproteobacteria bacterium]|nr:peptide-methionine (R)-S-oxide reductase MsrB [Alphaproteobacteria bacterium]HRJ66862.1 peptide-methionine (R)-S-oxide reductase MsrB [Alphaproteobacteria bacterium]